MVSLLEFGFRSAVNHSFVSYTGFVDASLRTTMTIRKMTRKMIRKMTRKTIRKMTQKRFRNMAAVTMGPAVNRR